MSNSGEVNGRPHNGHLGTTWEIAIVTVFVVLVFVILGTVIFQVRRKRQRRREEQEMMGDAEAGLGLGSESGSDPELSGAKGPSKGGGRGGKGDKTGKGGKAGKAGKVSLPPAMMGTTRVSDKLVVGKTPKSSHRHSPTPSSSSSSPDHSAKKSPRYYWDHR